VDFWSTDYESQDLRWCSGPALSDDSQFLHSSLREKVLEHLFVGDLLRCLWRPGRRDIELLRAEVDYAGSVTMELGPFLWFGADPGCPVPPLGDQLAKHVRADHTGTKGFRRI